MADVLQGQFAGRRLSELGLAQLQALRAEAAAMGDQSRLLLDACLDRAHPDWRAAMGAGQSSQGNGAGANGSTRQTAGRMSRAEARRIPEVSENATGHEIKSLAALIKQAKDVLLQRG